MTTETLPDELLLAIFSNLSTFPQDHQWDLLNLCRVSKLIYPVAQELRLLKPYLRLSKLNQLTKQYQSRPDIAARVTSLEIIAPHNRRLASQYVNLCRCLAHNLRSTARAVTVEHASILLSILPQLHTLLLGANSLGDLNVFQQLILGPGKTYCQLHNLSGWSESAYFAYNKMGSFAALQKRLRVLELPVQWADFNFSPFNWEISHCTGLKHLIAPARALFNRKILADHILDALPTSLEKLTITTSLDHNLPYLLWNIASTLPRKNLPLLHEIEIWSLSRNPNPTVSPPSVFHTFGNKYDKIEYLCKILPNTGINVKINYNNDPSRMVVEDASWAARSGRIRSVDYLALESRGLIRKRTDLATGADWGNRKTRSRLLSKPIWR